MLTKRASAKLAQKPRSEMVELIASVSEAELRGFVERLAAQAKDAGKLRRDFVVPDAWRRNTPARLAAALAARRERFPRFPFGSDFDEAELLLLPALGRLQALSANKAALAVFAVRALLGSAPRAEDLPQLARLGLAQPRGLAERLLRRVVARALHGV